MPTAIVESLVIEGSHHHCPPYERASSICTVTFNPTGGHRFSTTRTRIHDVTGRKQFRAYRRRSSPFLEGGPVCDESQQLPDARAREFSVDPGDDFRTLQAPI